MQTGCARVIPLWLTVVRQGRCIHEVIAYGDKNNRSYASEEGKQSLSLSLSFSLSLREMEEKTDA